MSEIVYDVLFITRVTFTIVFFEMFFVSVTIPKVILEPARERQKITRVLRK